MGLIKGSKSIESRGKPHIKRDFSRTITDKFSKISDLLDITTGLLMQENYHTFRNFSPRDLTDWNTIMEFVTEFLTTNTMT